MLAAPTLSAQVVVDDFEDGEFAADAFVFGGGEQGTLTLTDDTPDGSSFAARFEVDADEYGNNSGFGQPIDGGALDLTGIDDPVLQFDIAPTGTFTLEINLQNTGGGGEGEIRNALRFIEADGTYQRVALSLASFFPTNAASFEADDVFQYVWTVVDAQGDGDASTNETVIQIDNVQIVDGIAFENQVSALDFDDGDYSDANGYFYDGGGEILTGVATTDTPDGSANAFAGAIDGDEYGGYAVFGKTIDDAPIDVSGQEALNFYLRTNGDALLEINLQSGAAAGGDNSREGIRVSDTGGEYVQYSIPLNAFFQTTAEPADLSDIYNIVFVFVEIPGDSDTGTTEFEFALDGVGFGTFLPPVANELPPSLADAPSVFPNPAARAATVAFELAVASDVSVDVIDLLGRRVAEVASGARAAGPVRLAVPTSGLPSGVYIVRVQTEAGVASTRLTVVR